ncbi:hypothetical protein EDI_279790 [Entamoeba dispar SAW760]|uniref:Uncharacterized protein n=1 Tax=Entamoeba dispar (strain ATCC PRA-260 / SAW760) TaxID=370354 RepID=B0EI46_ENTDS|nr:uncharacterized protein EDI_279790 [Entamoeba dispar SAW760]EDR25799.1 hypothetical protein EDI_279790 [Entamoeba dispar SAW760]|eukprot:EDR25799.1 hypothetical protein EDI_279790 [Entamoeba dispar SAW760]
MSQTEWSLDFSDSNEISFDGPSAIHKSIYSIPYSEPSNSFVCICCNTLFFAEKNVLRYCSFGSDKIERIELTKPIIHLASLDEGIIVICEDYIIVYNVKSGFFERRKYSNYNKVIVHCNASSNGQTIFFMTESAVISMSWPEMENQQRLSFIETDTQLQNIKQIAGEDKLILVYGISLSAFLCIFETKAVIATTTKMLLVNITFDDLVVDCIHAKNRLFIQTQKEFLVFEQKISSLDKLKKLGSWKIPDNTQCKLNPYGASFLNGKTCIFFRWTSDMKQPHIDRIVFGSNFVDIITVVNKNQIISKTLGGFLLSEIPEIDKAEIRETKKIEKKKVDEEQPSLPQQQIKLQTETEEVQESSKQEITKDIETPSSKINTNNNNPSPALVVAPEIDQTIRSPTPKNITKRKEIDKEKELKRRKILEKFNQTNQSLAKVVSFLKGLEEKPYCSELPDLLKQLKF